MPSVFWFTGLSGVGKSTIANCFYKEIKLFHPSLFLDGDELRKALGAQDAFSYQERKKLAFQYARLCQLLHRQNTHVICATVSMFDEVREWNREHIPNYYEIYIQAPLSILKERKKLVYTSSHQVMGIDLPVEEPKHPDIILNNDGTISLEEHLDFLRHKLTHVYTN